MVCLIFGPIPPGPIPPGPTPAPIPAAGLHVLIVEESAERGKLPINQQSIILGATVRDYLDTHCAVEADGKTHGYRIWDKDVATNNESQLWQDAMKRQRSSVPWVVISNGREGYEGPLPKSVDEMMTLLRRFGG